MKPDLDELRRLEKAATPGEWTVTRKVCGTEILPNPGTTYMTEVRGPRMTSVWGFGHYPHSHDESWVDPNVLLIARLRNAAPWLLARLEKLERVERAAEAVMILGPSDEDRQFSPKWTEMRAALDAAKDPA